MYIYMYIYIYVYLCLYIYVYVCLYIHIYICIDTYPYVNIFIYAHARAYIHIFTNVYQFIWHIFVCVMTHLHVWGDSFVRVCVPLTWLNQRHYSPFPTRWDLKYSSKCKSKSSMVKIQVSFQMSPLKRDLSWPFRISICIPTSISSLIFSGTACTGGEIGL